MLFPTSVNAWEIETTCDFCGEFIADDWICPDGNHCGPESERGNCYEEHHCKQCGVCEDQAEWCSECNMRLDCALEQYLHCTECGTCLQSEGAELCPSDCGRCSECAEEWCDNCDMCEEDAKNAGKHCPE